MTSDDEKRASAMTRVLMTEIRAYAHGTAWPSADGRRIARDLLAEVDRLRALPVIATCGACGYESPSAAASADVCSVCTKSGPAQWSRVRADKSPPTWCPLRGKP